jgi:hypothetical protein
MTVERSKPSRHRFPGDVRRCRVYRCLVGGSDQEFGPAIKLPLGISWIGQGEAAKCSGRTAWGVIISRTVRVVLLTQIDFVAPREPETVTDLCLSTELRPRTFKSEAFLPMNRCPGPDP